MGEKITLKDIAAKSGYSLRTVKKVMSGDRSVREETRNHILETGRQLGYRKNMVASVLGTNKEVRIGIVLGDYKYFFPEARVGFQTCWKAAWRDLKVELEFYTPKERGWRPTAEVLDELTGKDNIDAVIQTIRESYDDAKENLMNRFGLSDVQAQAILDMQLKRLQGLEKEKLQNEYKELEARIAYFNELLSSEEKIRGVLKDELTAIRDRYGDDRVTEIQDVEDEIDIEDLIEEEECVFTLTAGGYIKRTAASTYKAQRRGGKGITAMSTKEEDYVDTVFTASTHDFILFFTNKGRVHRKKGYQIPEAGRTARGTNLVNVLPIEQDEKVTAMIHLREFPEDRYLVMVTRSGTVKRIQLSSIYTARKAGIRCITLDEGDELICVRETDGDQAILIVTHDGMAICFKETDVRCMGRDAAGVRGINLRPGDYVVGAARAKRDHQVLMITETGYGKRTDMDEYIRADGPQKRGGFGLKGYNVTEKTGPVVGVKVVSDGDDVLVINDAGVIIRMAAAGISTYGRTAQGVKIMNLEEGVKVISFARTDHEEEEEAAEGETPAGGPEQA